MDWFPTVLDLCGVKQPPNAPRLDGFNLLPLIHDAKAQLPRKTLHFAWGNKWAMREGDWKLIGVAGRPRVTLHNLADAKPEVKNYANDKPKIVDRLRMLHMAWAKDVTPKRQ